MAESKGPSPTYRLVAERVKMDTVDWLRGERETGESWRSISLFLWTEYRLDVTEVTLRKWWVEAHAAPEPEPVAP